MTDWKRGANTEHLSWTGDWWLPNTPQTRLPGVLKLSTERGPVLDLTGSLIAKNRAEPEIVEIIHGKTAEAEFVTLQNCREGRMSFDARGQYRTEYEVELAVTGERFPSVDSLGFQKVDVAFSTLVYWVNQPVFDREPSGTELDTVTVRPEFAQRLYQRDGLTLDVQYMACLEIRGEQLTLDIHPEAHIAFRWDKPSSVQDILPVVQRIRDFLTFATSIPTHVEAIRAEPLRFPAFGHAHEMRLFHRSFAGPKLEHDPLLPLFSLKDLTPEIEKAVSAWFEKTDVLQPVIDLRLAPVYNPQMQADNQFLAAVQALEAFHRGMRKNRVLPKDEHERRKDQILDSAPEQHRDWLEERLKYSNEPSLRRRVKSLFHESKEVFQNVDLRRKSFVGHVCDTRNYLTHYDAKLEPCAARGAERHRLIRGLRLLLDVSLLRELGVEENTVAELVRRPYMDLVKQSPGSTTE